MTFFYYITVTSLQAVWCNHNSDFSLAFHVVYLYFSLRRLANL